MLECELLESEFGRAPGRASGLAEESGNEPGMVPDSANRTSAEAWVGFGFEKTEQYVTRTKRQMVALIRRRWDLRKSRSIIRARIMAQVLAVELLPTIWSNP